MPRLLGVTFVTAGVLHFVRPRMYEAIMPRYLPAHRELVYASGVAEIAGGAGLLHSRTRRHAGWWLIATLLAIFPANVEMAVNAERFRKIPKPLLWARLPLQGALIAWVWEDRDAVAAAVAVAAQHGLRSTDPVILRDQLNVLVHLRPAPVVARVAGTIRRVRPGTDWQSRELAVAGFLADVGAPVVAPSRELPPGPHEYGGRVLSFWECAEGETDAVTAGQALSECHAALRGFKGSLPVLGGLSEAEAMLSRFATEGKLSLSEATALQRRFDDLTGPLSELRSPIQPLHGDAHLNNVLGGRWNDWEDTCLGPIGWDAACLIAGSQSAERQQAAFDAAGLRLDPGELALWVEARRLQIAVWRVFLSL